MVNSIYDLLSFFGISQAPETAQEFFWDLILLFVGLWFVKWLVVAVFNLMKNMTRWG